MQSPAPGLLKVPGGHIWAVALVEPDGQANPAAQGPVHKGDTCPGPDPYWPATQGPEHAGLVVADSTPYTPRGQRVQVPAPASLHFPGGHMNGVLEMEPGEHAYPAVQFPEHAAPLIPLTFPNLPLGHRPVQEAVVSPNVEP